MQGLRDIIAHCVMPLLDPWDFCSASQLSKLWSRSGRLHLSKSPNLKHALGYYAIHGMTQSYAVYRSTPAPSDILNAIKGGKTEFVKHWINTFPNINLDNRKSEDAKQLKSYLEACVEYSRDELFTLLYMRGGWYFLSLLVDIARSGNTYMLKQMAHPCLNTYSIMNSAAASAYHAKKWPAYNHLISLGATYQPPYLNQRVTAKPLTSDNDDIDATDDLELF